MATRLFKKFTGCVKVCGIFFLIWFSGSDWLDRQTSTWKQTKLFAHFLILTFQVVTLSVDMTSALGLFTLVDVAAQEPRVTWHRVLVTIGTLTVA